nr:hypothetical protein [Salinarimonas soli]
MTRLFRNITTEWLVLSCGLTVTPGHRFLTEHGTFEAIESILARGGRIVDENGALVAVTAERVVYSEATRHLYEEAEEVAYATQGGAALSPEIRRGWRTYNFEVEGLHTYVAGGIRVHNDSIDDYYGFVSLLGDDRFNATAYDGITAQFGPEAAAAASYSGSLAASSTFGSNLDGLAAARDAAIAAGDFATADAIDAQVESVMQGALAYGDLNAGALMANPDSTSAAAFAAGATLGYNNAALAADFLGMPAEYGTVEIGVEEAVQVGYVDTVVETVEEAVEIGFVDTVVETVEYGVVDYGVVDYGVVDYGVVDYGVVDYGVYDYGYVGYSYDAYSYTGYSYDGYSYSGYSYDGSSAGGYDSGGVGGYGGYGGTDANGNYGGGGSQDGTGYGGGDMGGAATAGGSDQGNQPIVLDLTGKGIRINPLTSSNQFYDMAGDGYQHRTAWAGVGNGVLVIDADGDGQITERREVVLDDWDVTAGGDLQALQNVFDTNDNGLLDDGDERWSMFKVMVTNADGTTTLMSLSELDIQSIDLTADETYIVLPDGSRILGQTTFTRYDGSTGAVADAEFRYDTEGYAVAQTVTHNADGSTTVTNTMRNPDGSRAGEIAGTTSGDGRTVTLKEDTDGDGVVDAVQTRVTVVNANGSETETLSNTTAAGRLLDRTVTQTSADRATVTIQRDATGDGITDQSETRTTLADGSKTFTVSDLSTSRQARERHPHRRYRPGYLRLRHRPERDHERGPDHGLLRARRRDPPRRRGVHGADRRNTDRRRLRDRERGPGCERPDHLQCEHRGAALRLRRNGSCGGHPVRDAEHRVGDDER